VVAVALGCQRLAGLAVELALGARSLLVGAMDSVDAVDASQRNNFRCLIAARLLNRQT
jgi:hypothetical protein